MILPNSGWPERANWRPQTIDVLLFCSFLVLQLLVFLQLLCCSAAHDPPNMLYTRQVLHYLLMPVLTLPSSNLVGFGYPFSHWEGDTKNYNLLSNLGFPSSFSYSFPATIV